MSDKYKKFCNQGKEIKSKLLINRTDYFVIMKFISIK